MQRYLHLALAFAMVFPSGCYYDKEELLYPGACNPGNASAQGYWAEVVEPIIAARCTSCHQPGGQGPGDLRTYDAVKAIVDNGSFRQLVLISRSMPQGGALTPCEIQKLQAWVDAGAPN